jgi:hypothetical protein
MKVDLLGITYQGYALAHLELQQVNFHESLEVNYIFSSYAFNGIISYGCMAH